MTTLRRFASLQMLMLWQGGFLFYTSVVVPVGTEVLGGSFEQSRITRQVTGLINLIGLVALAALAAEAAWHGGSPRQKAWIWGAWMAMALGLLFLFFVRERLLELVSYPDGAFVDRARFYGWHRVYLWISTFQWLAALVFCWTMIRAWRERDARRGCP
jgi:hypothetical protein